jgi:hypothetical protein
MVLTPLLWDFMACSRVMAHGTKVPEEFAATVFGIGECILPPVWVHHITSNAPSYIYYTTY